MRKKIDLDGLDKEAWDHPNWLEYYQVKALVAIAAELREMNERSDMRMAMALDAEERDYRETCNTVRPGGG